MPSLLITRFPYSSQFGGEEQHTINLAQTLQKRGWDIILWTSCPILSKEFIKLQKLNSKFKIQNSKLFPSPPVSKFSLLTFTLLSPFIFVYFFFKYFQILKANSYKLKAIYMLSLSEKLLLTPIIKLFSFFFLLSSPKIIWIEHARIGKWLTSNPWKIFYKLWSRFVKIICVSKQSAKYLSWAHNVVDIPNGIDHLSFLQEQESCPTDNKDSCFHRNDKRIGCIARLTPDKGIDTLIKAFKNIQNAELFIVGEGPDKANLIKLIKNSPSAPHIHLLSKLSREEILKFFKNIDIFVLPSSEHDPFGLVIAEAMASKIPTIVTNVCGISDYLEDEVHSKIIPAKNPEALEKAINWYIQNPEKTQKIIENAYKLCQEKFDLKKMVNEYEKFFS
ncbi:MAG: glycosyltransferase [Candidatus Peregrinibacteria bacterium GW2011_GWF2_33_10]|nr:MAG: glycosyltransferase [Candidatus Peregrinibacteria bacterium GW2011_GWF2_33_10]OGJ44708.1 MAG: hypothetical protein A2272_02425 [Candidatus Peregrinibacteria bacterium RIFOXYA12_FULL_33_12]OGJ46225.1 MAG: hypothetical protein A2263_05055 [Candidatus Peregrinibacteria bacterium RIFOXYA2_FULL_33_21]OGJ51641.1 MAG: hypothetical protein A2307_04225 [Candidatus Peregrinibacteria bacterium RIFOXYB2_FULL_33_20]